MCNIRSTTGNNEVQKRTRKLFTRVNHVSMVSNVKGSGNRPPTAKETMQSRESSSELR